MIINVLTLFPQIVRAYFDESIAKRAIERNLIKLNIINFRDYSLDKHHSVDDSTFGGGAGQLLMCEPIDRAITANNCHNLIFPTPSGYKFTQNIAKTLSCENELTFLCGRYEGVDQRVLDKYNAKEYCLGDYVASSGEVASLMMIDVIYRLIPGVITDESLTEESFCNGLLEYEQYTKPATWDGRAAPGILLSGNHEEIRKWRYNRSLARTKERRADLLDLLPDSQKDLLKDLSTKDKNNEVA